MPQGNRKERSGPPGWMGKVVREQAQGLDWNMHPRHVPGPQEDRLGGQLQSNVCFPPQLVLVTTGGDTQPLCGPCSALACLAVFEPGGYGL